jgi:hypothetical protein
VRILGRKVGQHDRGIVDRAIIDQDDFIVGCHAPADCGHSLVKLAQDAAFIEARGDNREADAAGQPRGIHGIEIRIRKTCASAVDQRHGKPVARRTGEADGKFIARISQAID